MQISSVQNASLNVTADRTGPPPAESTIQDRQRQDQTRRLARATKVLNDSGQIASEHELAIALDRHSGQPVIRLIDRNTKEVIQQIPEERVLRMAEEFKREAEKTSALGGSDWLSMHA